MRKSRCYRGAVSVLLWPGVGAIVAVWFLPKSSKSLVFKQLQEMPGGFRNPYEIYKIYTPGRLRAPGVDTLSCGVACP
jgi:hypothetical protein